MNKNYVLLILIGIISIHFSSCEEACDATDSDEIGGEFFTVEYRDPSGTNYLESIYNQNGIIVFLDTTGGESPNPKFELITPGFKDGKFGPFDFTERYIQQTNQAVNGAALFANPLSFNYFIKKDTFGQDTLRVEFLVSLDECRQYWQYIRYFLNGNPLNQYENQRQAEIVIIE
ncbi:MAG: hypothetical protein AAFR87_31135 [Bacteroidota bacterium]